MIKAHSQPVRKGSKKQPLGQILTAILVLFYSLCLLYLLYLLYFLYLL